MSVTIDLGAGEVNISTDTVSTWDEQPDNLLPEDVRKEILDNIVAYFKKKGFTVKLFPVF